MKKEKRRRRRRIERQRARERRWRREERPRAAWPECGLFQNVRSFSTNSHLALMGKERLICTHGNRKYVRGARRKQQQLLCLLY